MKITRKLQRQFETKVRHAIMTEHNFSVNHAASKVSHRKETDRNESDTSATK